MSEDFNKYLVIANHDIQRANNMEELKSYVASILYEMDSLEDRLRQKENIIKEVRELCSKQLTSNTNITGYSDEMCLKDILEILDKENI